MRQSLLEPNGRARELARSYSRAALQKGTEKQGFKHGNWSVKLHLGSGWPVSSLINLSLQFPRLKPRCSESFLQGDGDGDGGDDDGDDDDDDDDNDDDDDDGSAKLKLLQGGHVAWKKLKKMVLFICTRYSSGKLDTRHRARLID